MDCKFIRLYIITIITSTMRKKINLSVSEDRNDIQ